MTKANLVVDSNQAAKANPAIGVIRLYQKYLSPLFGRRCRYHPTCSTYAITAIERFGYLKGFRLAAWRILRCNPFTPGGVDDVPPATGSVAAR